MILKEVGRLKSSILRPLGLEPAPITNGEVNGEHKVLAFLRSLPEIAAYDSIVDVGANVGAWTWEALRCFGDTKFSNFYCVEPLPKFSTHIRERFAHDERVKVLQLALSASGARSVPMYEVGGGGRMYRTYRGQSKVSVKSPTISPGEEAPIKPMTEHMVESSTGDALFGKLPCRPYIVKIDCDGHDCHVLYGFKDFIAARRPIVQFEYCDFWIGAGSRLTDVCELLYRRDYKTFKIFPTRLREFKCSRVFETFSYQNILAVPAEISSFSRRTIEF